MRMPDLNFRKPDWRDRNFQYVRRHMSGVHEPFAILETFGESGPVSRQAALDAGIIPTPDYFYGVDNNAKVIYDYYKGGHQGGLYIGDIFQMAKHLSSNQTTHPIGFYNFDLMRLAGTNSFWHDEGTPPLILEAVQASIERLGACVVLLNQVAELPKARSNIAGVVKRQHERASKAFGHLGKIEAPPNFETVDRLEVEGYSRLNDNYEIYRTRQLYMLTLRFHVQRKEM